MKDEFLLLIALIAVLMFGAHWIDGCTVSARDCAAMCGGRPPTHFRPGIANECNCIAVDGGVP